MKQILLHACQESRTYKCIYQGQWVFYFPPHSRGRHATFNCCFLRDLPRISQEVVMWTQVSAHCLWMEEMLLMRKVQLRSVWYWKSWLLNPHPLFSKGAPVPPSPRPPALPHSSRNCPQNPAWTQRRQGSLATKNRGLLGLRLECSPAGWWQVEFHAAFEIWPCRTGTACSVRGIAAYSFH